MKIGDLVKYSEEAAKNRIAAVYGGHNVSEWLGVVVDKNPSYYFVMWNNQRYYDSQYGVAEVKDELVVVS
tara:strand:+ start:359 stop:568 length:210 start_codon:yes stop_codon:yes gene_type:complete